MPSDARRVEWVRGQMMACVPAHRSAEPDSLLIRVARTDRAALLAEAPDLYYAPDHYLGFDGVRSLP